MSATQRVEKSWPGDIATASDADLGTFSARVSVFDVIDHAGDRIRRGAFAESLELWRRSRKAIPVIWSHRLDSPDLVLGKVTSAHEDATGLVVDGQLDLHHAPAKRTFELLRSGAISDWSFSFVVLKSAPATSEGRRIRDITAVHLLEVGPTPTPCNPMTALLALKTLSNSEHVPNLADPDAGRYRVAAATARLMLHLNEGGDRCYADDRE